ncbi:MAG: hypothetical protein J6J61_02535 [Muribaculaceae bacterium]|nr:hypothetical protein [Muribaculaceae bacterium]MBP3639850.1 hypothetical protein [Muribaculaceae bacterium]
MGKNSTPGVSAPFTPASIPCNAKGGPRESTLRRLRQFARVYAAPLPAFQGVVLN